MGEIDHAHDTEYEYQADSKQGEEPTLEHLIQRVGIEPFAFSTDYPHEVDFAAVRKQISETKELTFMNDQQKSAFLGDNSRRFFNLG